MYRDEAGLAVDFHVISMPAPNVRKSKIPEEVFRTADISQGIVLIVGIQEINNIQTLDDALLTAVGHLVFATMDTSKYEMAIFDILKEEPPDIQLIELKRFYNELRAVVSQKLERGDDGRLHPTYEILRWNVD